MQLIYRICSQDNIVFVNNEWIDFAISNGANELVRESIIGRSLWDFISDDTTIHIYRELFVLVRNGRNAEFNFRCDSPSIKRYMKMTIMLTENNIIQLETMTLNTENCEKQIKFAEGATNNLDLLNICGWCKKVKIDTERWEEIEQAVETLDLFNRASLPFITHGICPRCLTKMKAKIKSLKAVRT